MSDIVVKDTYKKQGINLVPIPKGSGKALEIKWTKYQSEMYVGDIPDELDFAVILGKVSGNLIVIDFDECNDLNELNQVLPDILNQTLVVRTGDGYHSYFTIDELPTQANVYLSKGTYKMEVKGQGAYVIGASCKHYDKDENGKYVLTGKEYNVVSNVTKIKRLHTNGINLIKKLKRLGWISKTDYDTNGHHITISTAELEKGKWGEGERYTNGFKLALRKFHMNWSYDDILNEALKINESCAKKHNVAECERWVNDAHNQFEKNTKDPENTYFKESEDGGKDDKKSKRFSNKEWKIVSYTIQGEDNFATVRETKEMWMYDKGEGVYIPNADTYIEEKAETLISNCNTQSRNEIKNTIKARGTMILASDFFDSNIINTESGIIDPNTFDILPHSPEYLTTTKLPFAVDEKADNYKLFLHIVKNIIEPKDIALFLEIIWVLIAWKNPHKKCIIFKGVSDTQKTTLMEIISWIIGSKNIASVKPQKFLVSGDRFSMSRFIGKRGNFSEEINNLTPEMLENLKAMIGGMIQETELKNSNDGREFDPKRFLFVFSTNFLDAIYHRIDDNSMINRFQFMMFKHVVKKKKGDWEKDFFIDEDDKRTSIETIIRLVLAWKKSGKEVRWDEPWQTKEILRTEQPIEDKYFESGRIIQKRGGKLTLDEVKKDFEIYCKTSIENQAFGYLMKQKGFESKHSGLKTYYHGYSLAEVSKNKTLQQGNLGNLGHFYQILLR